MEAVENLSCFCLPWDATATDSLHSTALGGHAGFCCGAALTLQSLLRPLVLKQAKHKQHVQSAHSYEQIHVSLLPGASQADATWPVNHVRFAGMLVHHLFGVKVTCAAEPSTGCKAEVKIVRVLVTVPQKSWPVWTKHKSKLMINVEYI